MTSSLSTVGILLRAEKMSLLASWKVLENILVASKKRGRGTIYYSSTMALMAKLVREVTKVLGCGIQQEFYPNLLPSYRSIG